MILGEDDGYLQVVDIENWSISHTHYFKETGDIVDIISIADNNFMIAAFRGIFKTTRDQVIKHCIKGQGFRTLAQINEKLYLIGHKW